MAELPSQRVQRRLHLRGRPFRLWRRPHLVRIYDGPELYKVLMTGRQVEKTTTIAAMLVDYVTSQPYREAFYAAARPDYITDFSTTRLTRFIFESPGLHNYLRGAGKNGVVNQVHHKVLSNMSVVYIRSIFLSAARARGPSVGFLTIDELSEMISDHIAVVEQTQAHQPFGRRLYAGTPLTFDNTLAKHWAMSTQNKWACPCSAGHWNFLEMENIGPTGPICCKSSCRKPINAQKGQWVEGVKGAPWDGYHFNQLMVPWLQEVNPGTGKSAWDKILQDQQSYSERLFRNEILGEPYSTGQGVISKEQMLACCESYRFTGQRKTMGIQGPEPLFMGIDWGGPGKPRTAVAIVGHLSLGASSKLRLLHGCFFSGEDHLREAEQIAEMIREWKISQVIADYGNGYDANMYLQRMVGVRVTSCHLSGTTERPLKWIQGENRWVASRTVTLTALFDRIRAKKIGFPPEASLGPFIPEFTCIFAEENEKTRIVKFDKKGDATDDFAHALNFAVIGWGAHFEVLGYKVVK